MDLTNLQIIQALVGDSHLSRVAHRFKMTQSALSKRLHAIEDELGFKLFIRHGVKGLEATPAALEIASSSEQILATWQISLNKAKQHLKEPTHFGIVGPQIFMREIILPWWSRMRDQFPELTLEARISSLTKTSFALVQAGMDVGILEHKESLEGYICKPVFYENWGIVVHKDVNLTQEKLSESTLSQLQWGTFSQSINLIDEWLVRRQRMPPPVYKLYWSDFTALLNWVIHTPQAATILPSHACRSALKEQKVQFISLGQDSRRVLYIAYRKDHPYKNLIQELMSVGLGG